VFLQAYRPHGLAGPKDCAALHPGIGHASLTGFSPWAMGGRQECGFSLSSSFLFSLLGE
jgi:hypothetical protein